MHDTIANNIGFKNNLNVTLTDKRLQENAMKHFHIPWKEKYGDIIKLKIPFQKPMLFLYNADDIQMIYKLDGKHPFIPSFEALRYFRKNHKKDLFPISG